MLIFSFQIVIRCLTLAFAYYAKKFPRFLISRINVIQDPYLTIVLSLNILAQYLISKLLAEIATIKAAVRFYEAESARYCDIDF